LGTRNQELEQPPRYGSHLNRRPESRIKSIGWPPSIEQSPSTLRDTPQILLPLPLPLTLTLALATLFAGCGSSSPVAAVLFINEVLPSNSNDCADEVGERNDWIELYNAGEQEIELGGFSITDDSASPEKKRFAEGVVISAGAALLLWADDTPDQGETHLPFKLKAKGEGVLLYDADRQLVDQVRWSDAVSDVSFARIPDGGGELVPCASPTCGTKNGSMCAD
ncbi:MAG: lamin tail domain-containing protein, partial [Pseudomonadota bacterium]